MPSSACKKKQELKRNITSGTAPNAISETCNAMPLVGLEAELLGVLLVGCSFFFTDPATTEIYPLSLHDALPIYVGRAQNQLLSRLHAGRQTRQPERDWLHTRPRAGRRHQCEPCQPHARFHARFDNRSPSSA